MPSYEQGEPPILPPPEYWLINKGERLETPTDDRRIVDVDATVELVKAQLAPGYEWPSGLDVHHFEWYRHRYPNVRQPGVVNPYMFCELPPHKGLVPRVFHNFLHEITLPPPIPSEEVMFYRVEGLEGRQRLV